MLAEGGAPEALAPQVAAALGEGADGRLREDPWQLLRVAGVRPEQADGFARALLGAECGPGDERRGRAVAVWLLEQAALRRAHRPGRRRRSPPRSPSAWCPTRTPPSERRRRGRGAGLPGRARGAAGGRGAEADGEDDEAERPRTSRRAARPGPVRAGRGEPRGRAGPAASTRVPKEAPEPDWERGRGLRRGSAAELIRAVAGSGLVLHTGGEAARAEPAALVAAARAAGLRAYAAAHTENGRRRLARRHRAADGGGVVTVAGLLSGAEGPGRDADGAPGPRPAGRAGRAAARRGERPPCSWSRCRTAPGWCSAATRQCCGRPGPGRVFADLLAARVCPRVVSRTPDPGPIGELVSGVGVGELTQVEAPGKEVVIVPVRDARRGRAPYGAAGRRLGAAGLRRRRPSRPR